MSENFEIKCDGEKMTLYHVNEHVTITLDRYWDMIDEIDTVSKANIELEEKLNLYERIFLDPVFELYTHDDLIKAAWKGREQIFDEIIKLLKKGDMKVEQVEDPSISPKKKIFWTFTYDPMEVNKCK